MVLLPAAIGIVAVLSLAAIFPAVVAQDGGDSSQPLSDNETSTTESSISNETDFRNAMRDLWVDHIVYTRQFIVDTADDLLSINDTTNRLLKNQEDIGNAIKPYYGEEAGSQLSELLNQHILIAADLVNAAKAGNDSAVADADQRWSDNADDIAAFLAGANPNWTEEELSNMLHDHLNVTRAEAVARLQGNYTADIGAFDDVHEQAMHMADAISDGIIAQFPQRFED
jgi:hypothetical protein